MKEFDSRKRQEITNVYRRLPNSVLHFNNDKKTATATLNGRDQGVLIFGSTFELLSSFANGKITCSTKEIFERMNQQYPRR